MVATLVRKRRSRVSKGADVDDYTYHLMEERRSGRMSRREFLRRVTVAGVSLAIANSLLAACGSSEEQGNQGQAPTGPIKRGGTARLGLVVPASDPEPVTMFSSGAIFTVMTAAEGLCFPRPDYSLEPKLATKWESANGAKEWTFTLREGVKFHDGSASSGARAVRRPTRARQGAIRRPHRGWQRPPVRDCVPGLARCHCGAPTRGGIAKAKRLLSDAGHSGGIEVELTTERFLEIPQYAVTLKELATKAAKLQQEETPGIIAYWTEELRVLKNNVAGLAKGPNIVLDMSPVWTSG